MAWSPGRTEIWFIDSASTRFTAAETLIVEVILLSLLSGSVGVAPVTDPWKFREFPAIPFETLIVRLRPAVDPLRREGIVQRPVAGSYVELPVVSWLI